MLPPRFEGRSLTGEAAGAQESTCRPPDSDERLATEIERRIVERSEEAVDFEPIGKRWIVEWTFGWLNRCRRLSKDYAKTLRVAEATIKLAMIHPMVCGFAPVNAFLTSS